MTPWVLIILTYAVPPKKSVWDDQLAGVAVSTSSVAGFGSKAQCEKAGVAAAGLAKGTSALTIRTVCVEASPQ